MFRIVIGSVILMIVSGYSALAKTGIEMQQDER
jgi:hypothetical protein